MSVNRYFFYKNNFWTYQYFDVKGKYSSIVNYLLEDDFLKAAVCPGLVSYTDLFFYARQ